MKEFMEDAVILHTARAAGDICYVKNGTTITYDGSSGVYATPAVSGTSTAPVRIIGYSTTIADGGIIEILDSSGGSNVPYTWDVDYWHLYNHKYTDIRRLDLGGANNGLLLYNIEIVNALDNDFDPGAGSGDCLTFINCKSTNSRGTGFFIRHRATRLINCKATGANTNGFELGNASYGAFAVGCIAYDCTDGFQISGEGELVNCIADSNSANGFVIDDDRFTTFVNCGATNNGGYGITGAANSFAFILNCGSYLNTSGFVNTTNVTILQNISPQITDPKYTSAGVLTLQSDSPWIDAGNGYNG